MTKIYCSKCGKRCDHGKRYNDGICGHCRGTHSRWSDNRIYALRDSPDGQKYNTIECRQFPNGTVFIRQKASGVKHLFTVDGTKLVFTRKGKVARVDPKRYEAFYSALKEAKNGWTKSDCAHAWYGENVAGRNISLVLDALDNLGLLTSEDDNGRIFAYVP